MDLHGQSEIVWKNRESPDGSMKAVQKSPKGKYPGWGERVAHQSMILPPSLGPPHMDPHFESWYLNQSVLLKLSVLKSEGLLTHREARRAWTNLSCERNPCRAVTDGTEELRVSLHY